MKRPPRRRVLARTPCARTNGTMQRWRTRRQRCLRRAPAPTAQGAPRTSPHFRQTGRSEEVPPNPQGQPPKRGELRTPIRLGIALAGGGGATAAPNPGPTCRGDRRQPQLAPSCSRASSAISDSNRRSFTSALACPSGVRPRPVAGNNRGSNRAHGPRAEAGRSRASDRARKRPSALQASSKPRGPWTVESAAPLSKSSRQGDRLSAYGEWLMGCR